MALKLKGDCNRCGRCCEAIIEGRRFRCTNLQVTNIIGLPKASFCRVYKQRYDGMRIVMQDPSTGLAVDGTCALNTEEETKAVIDRGIGRGCSLEVCRG